MAHLGWLTAIPLMGYGRLACDSGIFCLLTGVSAVVALAAVAAIVRELWVLHIFLAM
jgi:hypothetical protein